MSSEEDKVDKFDYLKAKYIFRYPFTFKAIKWGAAIGSFLALHAFIKHRSAKKSLESFIWGTMFSGFPIWAFFMAKYSFYQDSIDQYEKDESEKFEEMDSLKRLM